MHSSTNPLVPTLFTPALMVVLALGLGACQSSPDQASDPVTTQPTDQPTSEPSSAPTPDAAGGTLKAGPPPEGMAVATFAGGCFWCMEPPFEKVDGVQDAISGYTGGKEESPTYKQVAYGRTGHTETVRVIYDPNTITYDDLLDIFWKSMDPTDAGGQFVDRGSQYRPGIFVHNEEQRQAAEASKAKLAASKRFGDKPIVVPIQTAGDFWIAEEYHQDFYKKSTAHYKRYRSGSGRDAFIARYWK
ncbi:MAG: peptide-methionine (S)-S-oxide reductase MsrA [Myxococcota bacterium]